MHPVHVYVNQLITEVGEYCRGQGITNVWCKYTEINGTPYVKILNAYDYTALNRFLQGKIDTSCAAAAAARRPQTS